jgi:hypothetical protein
LFIDRVGARMAECLNKEKEEEEEEEEEKE